LAGRGVGPDFVLSAATPWEVARQLTDPPDPAGGAPALAAALRQDYPEGRFTGRVFATETVGDYLIWALPRDLPLLAYSHGHLFPPEHWQDFLDVENGMPTWREVLALRRINLVIVEPALHPRLAALLRSDQEWLVVVDEQDDPAKRDPKTRLLVA